jgi:hypothetical protein
VATPTRSSAPSITTGYSARSSLPVLGATLALGAGGADCARADPASASPADDLVSPAQSGLRAATGGSSRFSRMSPDCLTIRCRSLPGARSLGRTTSCTGRPHSRRNCPRVNPDTPRLRATFARFLRPPTRPSLDSPRTRPWTTDVGFCSLPTSTAIFTDSSRVARCRELRAQRSSRS